MTTIVRTLKEFTELDIGKLKMKELEYYKFISTHKENVMHAYAFYSDKIFTMNYQHNALLDACLKHDNSKLTSYEFPGFRAKYFPISGLETISDSDYQLSLIHFYNNNPYRPEYWIKTTGATTEMPDLYLCELILDWIATSMETGEKCYDWYKNNKDRFVNNLADITRANLESLLNTVAKVDEINNLNFGLSR